ncbi:type II toxin-antitoxin system HicA family toxin [Treponema endosymbiont of Eucomonympha sp.]|uniref:type II toxin-antitoxin system HicA family toxin n=1 Tax=Treponema endosymbiont of Eucomonympha sp. TaxID=1580831 RepID=UPI0027D21260|nr:type II toxin-antitoxin system HicA family toxin [Treponema endosymbiont of Eucomonympha sp.]
MKILRQHGWTLDRVSGSHYVFEKSGLRPVPVPYHGSKDLGDFAKEILKEAGITV